MSAVDAGARERVVRFRDPAETSERVRERGGLEAMRAMLAGEIPGPPIAALMNLGVTEVDEGRVVFTALADESHYNPVGIVHGGFALTVFDSALGCAIHTMLPVGVGYATSDIQVRFVRPITAATGPVRCEARAVNVGRTTAIAEATLVDGAGKLLGTATTACAILRP